MYVLPSLISTESSFSESARISSLSAELYTADAVALSFLEQEQELSASSVLAFSAADFFSPNFDIRDTSSSSVNFS